MKQEFKIDDLLRTVINNELVDQPSADFTDRVMHSVSQESIRENTLQYRPFFSGYLWIAIACFILGIIVLNFVVPSGSSGNFFSGFGFVDSILSLWDKIHLPFQMPAMLTLIIACASIMLFMQIFIIGKFIKRTLQ